MIDLRRGGGALEHIGQSFRHNESFGFEYLCLLEEGLKPLIFCHRRGFKDKHKLFSYNVHHCVFVSTGCECGLFSKVFPLSLNFITFVFLPPWRCVYPMTVCMPHGGVYTAWRCVYPMAMCLQHGGVYTS